MGVLTQERHGVDEILEVFSAKDAERHAVADAILQAAIDARHPVTFLDASKQFVAAGLKNVVADELVSRQGIGEIARKTSGLSVTKSSFDIDEKTVPDALSLEAKRLSVLRAIQEVLLRPEAKPPKTKQAIAERVRELLLRCVDPEHHSGQRGRIMNVDTDERASTIVTFQRMLGRSPQLQAFLAAVVSGGDVRLEKIDGALRDMGVEELPKRPRTLVATAEDVCAVSLESDQVSINPHFLPVLEKGIASSRYLIAGLHKRLPPEQKYVARGVTAPPKGFASPPKPRAVTPVVELPAEEKTITAIEPPARRGRGRPRGKKKDPSVPQPAAAHRLIADTADDEEEETPARKRVNNAITEDGRQTSSYDPVRDNPILFGQLVDKYLDEGMDVKLATKAADAKMRACMPAASGSAPVEAEPDERRLWPLMPKPRFSEPEGHNGNGVANVVHDKPQRGSSSRIKNVMDAIMEFGDDELFEGDGDVEPTTAVPGSRTKLEILEDRVRTGKELWIGGDRHDCEKVAPHDLPQALQEEAREREQEIEIGERERALATTKKVKVRTGGKARTKTPQEGGRY